MSPDSVKVSKKFHEKFKVTLVCRDYWDTWTSKTHISKMCERCVCRTQTSIKEWEIINDILDNQTPSPSKEVGEKLWFYEDIDYEEVVANKHAVQCDQYRLMRNSTKLIDDIEENEEEDIDEDAKDNNQKGLQDSNEMYSMARSDLNNNKSLNTNKIEEEKESRDELSLK